MVLYSGGNSQIGGGEKERRQEEHKPGSGTRGIAVMAVPVRVWTDSEVFTFLLPVVSP